jgi:transposase
MPQVQLPIFPQGVTHITPEIAFQCQEGKVCYFNGHLPVFVHEEKDLATFRMFSSQLVINGNATQAQIARAFGVPLVTVKRYVKLYRQKGVRGFFAPPKRRAGPKLTPEVIEQAQALLNEGLEVPEVGRRVGILANTLHKAIRAGRLVQNTKKKSVNDSLVGSTKSQRSEADKEAPMGYGTTRTLERMAAAVGMLDGAPIEFERVLDVPDGGVLFALPALLENGLLSGVGKIFTMSQGYYPIETIFLLLALMALARIPSLEGLRYVIAGEWGKLLGLDRIPEVRTLREKLSQLCSPEGRAERWSSQLAREWMADTPQGAGLYYADGHVRLYHGKLTALPRRYVARQRLCLRGTTDYWVNAMDGRPFFVVSQAVDPGLLSVLREEIVPRLLTDAPGQPSAEALAAEPLSSRFTIVFDREGYSPPFFREMKQLRIAVLTYHKFPGQDWSLSEFEPRQVTLVHGEKVILELAERGVRLSNGLWVREVRQRCEKSGHQVALLCTDYQADLTRVAAALFARWCQENFFKYMRENFSIDRLVEYGTEVIPDTTQVVNPAWRELDSQIRRQNGLLQREIATFGDIHLPADLNPAAMAACEQEKGALSQRIEARRAQIAALKAQRKALLKHIPIKDLPEKDRFSRLRSEKKHFVDTIKLIAYRAETAMAQIAREKMARLDDARALMRQLYRSEVDLLPDHINQTLTVRLHHLTTNAHDQIIAHLCAELNATETVFPGTHLRLIYQLGGSS